VTVPNRVAATDQARPEHNSGTRSFSSRVVCVAIGFAALIATSALLHALFPPAIPGGVAAKLKFFTENKDEFDTLFVGTSAIYYSVSPEIFDRTTRESGLPTHSFNFGIDAMHPPENFYVLEQILKTKPRNLKWVFLETADVQMKLHQEMGTERAVYWHDWPRTALTLRKAFDPRGGAKWYIKISRLWLARRDFATHLALFAKRFANVGRVDLLSSHRERADAAEVELGPKRDGYRLAGDAMSAENAASFQKRLAQEITGARPKQIDPYAEEAYRNYAGQIRQIGAEVFFVATPLIFQSPISFRASPPGPLLAFNDSKTYPMLFDPKVRIDDAHLTKEGAEEFTRLLAQEFVRRARRP
jgi:hypothetical protein